MTDSHYRWWWLLLPLGWMAAIFVFSSDWFAWRNTAPLARGWLAWWMPNLDQTTVETFHLVIRKLGHVTEYALLALLWHVALRRVSRWTPWQASLGAVGISIGYAGFDEWRQTFTAERSGSLTDVGLDSLGVLLAAAGIAALYLARALRDRMARSARAYHRRRRHRPRYSYAARSE
ncbi:MAG: VanZ family protein [Chloracidobacterium sp.]|uniref:VanZ family protein n=1 Tax=Chloracidobacterium validum TaxID=2821543 RepID=A0ABX8B797_9BACT|nr:VanZ family protein [Chloracidobacterium validum]QUW02832.1 VanZ family protein [Chloracidobacterium validum]